MDFGYCYIMIYKMKDQFTYHYATGLYSEIYMMDANIQLKLDAR